MRVLRGLGLALLAVVGLAAVVAAGARCADGPVGPFAGGRLVAGELAPAPADWSFARGDDTLELQLVVPPSSRTTWLVVQHGHLYVPCGFPAWKQWPHRALDDGRAVVRLEGRRYEVRAVRVEEPAEFAAVAALVSEKYGVGSPDEPPDPDALWIFRMEPR
jgi:hypothetical protein